MKGKEFLGAVANRFAALQHLASSGRNGMDRDCAFFEGVHEGRVVQGAAGDHAQYGFPNRWMVTGPRFRFEEDGADTRII